MPVGFGFSVGDFIAAIELVGTVIDALQRSGSAATEYRELISQLVCLENALLQVKRLDFDDGYRCIEARSVAVLGCGISAAFGVWWEGGRKSDARAGWMKIKWAVFKRDDIASFKANLVGHTESINLLLAALQMSKAITHEKKQDERHQTLAGRVQENYFDCMQRLSAITELGKRLLEMTTTVMTTTVKVFQAVLEIQHLLSRIPGQVERQQPVYLLDAIGRPTPFHLEFIRSAEALVAVLKINFQKYGRGAEKIERGEFAIQDSATTRDINLEADWEISFFPGQRVDMSMIVTRYGYSTGSDDKGNCPFCEHASSLLGEHKTLDIEWLVLFSSLCPP
ncbi:hypothetical protein LSUB1_G002624 [Lachnellula subtilissima]|uniref:Ubiquitin-like domain-containing protein n=1 Tax=Lachnellula subtilissima TaxID=602034 RepID=A0A8H8RRM9_9HELO|nr:hypothetical protein LSUB1_G002624 [Lachnellula subtilissima]